VAFSEFELKRIDSVMRTISIDKVPKHLRDQLRFEYEVKGHAVTVWEIRPAWNDPTQETKMGVARFRYTRKSDSWKLYWMRKDLKWHAYDPDVNIGRLESLVAEVDRDEYGAFFG
jgi:hypothetical protein